MMPLHRSTFLLDIAPNSGHSFEAFCCDYALRFRLKESYVPCSWHGLLSRGVSVIDPQDDETVRGVFCELGFITGAAELVPVLRQAKKASCVSDITVLLEGETGTG